MPTAAPRGAAVGTRSGIDSTGSRLGEAGDQGAEGIAPEALRGRVSGVPRSSTAASPSQREWNWSAASPTLRSPMRSAAASGSKRSCSTASAVEAAARKRGRRRVGAVECDREERRVLEREASEDERRLDEVGAWIVGRGQRLDVSLEKLEGAQAEGGEQPVLRSEQAVDRARRRAGVACHLAQREGVDAVLRDRALGRRRAALPRSCRRAPGVVPSLDSISQQRYVTALRNQTIAGGSDDGSDTTRNEARVRREGAGTPVVLLHGLTFDRRTWRPIVEGSGARSGASRSTCRPTARAAGRRLRSMRSPPRCTSCSVRWRLTARSWSATRCRVGLPSSTHRRIRRAASLSSTTARTSGRSRSSSSGSSPCCAARRSRGVATVRGQPRTRAHPGAVAVARARKPRGEARGRRRVLGSAHAHRSGRVPGVDRRTDPSGSTCRASPCSGGRSPTASASGSLGWRTSSSRSGSATATSSTWSTPTVSPRGCASSSSTARPAIDTASGDSGHVRRQSLTAPEIS